ncbi:hypothetical protein [Patulibacter americanus]|uniref:hypothetical protein n=1 Tax=Patulibacter americanus TaxID=588672 RepID=UPI0003B56C2E|nr:hypothetical protein [Patulibacter americanus]
MHDVAQPPAEQAFEQGTRRRAVRVEQHGRRFDVVHRWHETPEGFARPELPAALSALPEDGPFLFRAPADDRTDADAGSSTKANATPDPEAGWRYRDVGALGVFNLLRAAEQGSDVLERALAATGRALRLAHAQPAQGGPAAHARLDRMRAVAAGAPGLPAREARAGWRADVGAARWDALGARLDEVAVARPTWILGDAAIAGLRWRPPAQLVVLVDGHAGPGVAAVDVGFLLGELLELAVGAREDAPATAAGLRRAAAALLDASGCTGVDERRHVATVAAWRPLLHAVDFCAYVGAPDEHDAVAGYGRLAAEVGAEAEALVDAT